AVRGADPAGLVAGGGVAAGACRQHPLLLDPGPRGAGVHPLAAACHACRAPRAGSAGTMKKGALGAPFSSVVVAQRDCSFDSRRRNSTYSHTRVTISANAPYHSM